MKKIFYLFLLTTFITACDDGDIITTSFDFDDASLELCGASGSYVFYKINSGGTESISVRLGEDESIFLESADLNFTLEGESNFSNYRIYDGTVTSNYFCADIPPTSPGVSRDFLASSGVAQLLVETILDDNDGIDEPVDEELDTDMDGIPNYIDFDDDGDNVPTSVELGDNDPDTPPRDSDNDEIPDYLDADDDNDMIPTINEDRNMNLNPADDIDNVEIGPNYLNAEVIESFPIEEYRLHTWSLSSSISLILANSVFVSGEETIVRETINMGDIDNVVTGTIENTPDFEN